VTWVIGRNHTVTADDGAFEFNFIEAGGQGSHTFNATGTFGYYCRVHGSLTSGMRGTVTVQP
jgi:plastocyanin